MHPDQITENTERFTHEMQAVVKGKGEGGTKEDKGSKPHDASTVAAAVSEKTHLGMKLR